MKATFALKLIAQVKEDIEELAKQRAYDPLSVRLLGRLQVLEDICREAKKQAVVHGSRVVRVKDERKK